MIEWPLKKKLMYEQALGVHANRQQAAQEAAQAQQQGDVQSPQGASGAGMGERTAPNSRSAQKAARRAQEQMGAADAFGGGASAAPSAQPPTPQQPRVQTGDPETDQALNHPGVRNHEHVYRVVPEEELPTWEEMGYEDADEEFAEFDKHFAEKTGESFGGVEMPEDATPQDPYLTEEYDT